MSRVLSREGSPAILASDLIEGLGYLMVTNYAGVASTALILQDWLLTIHDEMTFVWRRGRGLYTRTLFVGARYAALACAILYLFQGTTENNQAINIAMGFLKTVTIFCSEAIFATRTWAIWERSRPILIFLIGLTVVCISLITVMTGLSTSKALETPVTLVIEGVGQVQIPVITVKYAWLVSIQLCLVLLFQSVVFALTMYRLFGHRRLHRHAPPQSRSALVDVLWADGIMYFVFMSLVGVLNAVLIIAISHIHAQFTLIQLQVVLQSILATRIVFHTAKVLRQDIVDSRVRGTSTRDRPVGSLRFEHGTSVELTESGVQGTRS